MLSDDRGTCPNAETTHGQSAARSVTRSRSVPVLYTTRRRVKSQGPTGKKTPGGAGTHTGHAGHTGARGHTEHTDEPHNHPSKPNQWQTRTLDKDPHDLTHNHPSKPNDTPARPCEGLPVMYRFKDTVGSRDTHETDTRCTGKKTPPGGAGTHTGHTGHTGARATRAHGSHTDEHHYLTAIQTQRHTRTSTRRPKPRPTQQP